MDFIFERTHDRAKSKDVVAETTIKRRDEALVHGSLILTNARASETVCLLVKWSRKIDATICPPVSRRESSREHRSSTAGRVDTIENNRESCCVSRNAKADRRSVAERRAISKERKLLFANLDRQSLQMRLRDERPSIRVALPRAKSITVAYRSPFAIDLSGRFAFGLSKKMLDLSPPSKFYTCDWMARENRRPLTQHTLKLSRNRSVKKCSKCRKHR